MSIRALAQKLTRRLVIPRRLPREFGSGRMYCSTMSGGLKYLKPSLRGADPHLLELVEELARPGMSVWDIGANLGLFGLCAAHRVGPSGFVLAVEPDIDTARLLLRSRRAMDRSANAPMDVLTVAVGTGPSRVARFQISKCRAANSLAGHGTSVLNVTEDRVVPLYGLDELLADFRPPDLMKIDVEGAEVVVLESAGRILAEHQPVIAIEVGGERSSRVAEILKAHGYRLYDADQPRSARAEVDLAAWNCLAIPASVTAAPQAVQAAAT